MPYAREVSLSDFSKDLLLLMLQEYELFMDSFQLACRSFQGETDKDIAAMGFKSNQEYHEIMFLREITHSINVFHDIAEIMRLYSKRPEMASERLADLLSKKSEWI